MDWLQEGIIEEMLHIHLSYDVFVYLRNIYILRCVCKRYQCYSEIRDITCLINPLKEKVALPG
jgi:hypothetical protein